MLMNRGQLVAVKDQRNTGRREIKGYAAVGAGTADAPASLLHVASQRPRRQQQN